MCNKQQTRKITREIRLTEIYLEEHKMQFEFTKYTHLRHPVDFASRSWIPWKRKELARNMLHHQVAPVHTSLTDFNVSARALHKCILGFMGDRKYPNRNDLAVELVTQGFADANISTEIFCLLIKQLTKNPETQMPSPEASRDGRGLMALCCSCLVIDAVFENFLLSYVVCSACVLAVRCALCAWCACVCGTVMAGCVLLELVVCGVGGVFARSLARGVRCMWRDNTRAPLRNN